MVFVQKWPFFQNFFFQAMQASKMSFTIFQSEKTPFQAIKPKSSKSRKIDIFPKVLTHGFGPKMVIFLIFLFQAIKARKISFMIFQNEKTPFQAVKTKSSKSRKIDIFPRGLTHGFGLKMAVFPAFNFQAIQARKNFFYDILEQKNAFLGYKNKKFKKVEKLTFFQRVMVLV